MEPIRRIPASDPALARIAALQAAERVERRDPGAGPDERRRRPKPRPPERPPAGEVRRDADGVPHVDIRA